MKVSKAQYSTIEVLVAMPMTQWEFTIVSCLAGGNAPATCLKMLVMRIADVQGPAPLSLLLHLRRNINFSLFLLRTY